MGEEEIINHVWKVRSRHNLLHKTYLYHFDLKNSPYYKHLPLIQEVYDKKTNKDWRFTPLYYVCIYTKFFALRKAIEINPFQTDNFCWLDFGLYHIAEPVTAYEFIDNFEHFDNERIKIILLDTLVPNIDKTDFYSKDNYVTTAQIFGGHKDKVIQFCDRFDKELDVSLNLKLPINEENIMAIIYGDYPKDFDASAGFYISALKNFLHIRDHYGKVMSIVQSLRCNNYNKFAYDILCKIFSGNINLSIQQWYIVYTEIIITSYYAVGVEKYREYVGKFKKFCEENNIIIDEFTKKNLIY